MFGIDLGLGGLFEAGAQHASARDLQERSHAFTEKMYKHRHQFAVKDLRKAGLNPILAMGSGAGSQGGGTTSGSAVSSGFTLKDAEKKNVEANTEANEANAESAKAVAEANKANAERTVYETQLFRKELEAMNASDNIFNAYIAHKYLGTPGEWSTAGALLNEAVADPVLNELDKRAREKNANSSKEIIKELPWYLQPDQKEKKRTNGKREIIRMNVR